jgi:hypothetical protein
MAVDQADAGYLLPCGRTVDDAWERLAAVDAGRADEHELSCPHCRTAHQSLRALRDATEELAADLDEPAPGLTDRIMSAVRADIRRRDMLPLPAFEPGAVEISEQAVAAVLRFAADEVPGVRARRCRLSVRLGPDGEPLVDAELTLAVSYLSHTHGAVEVVRERAAAACVARVGFRLARLDLLVDDIYEGDR